MLFTEEQINFIDNMITSRLRKGVSKSDVAKTADYHNLAEIRLLIVANLASLKKDIGDEEFDLNVLRFMLKKYTTMRPADTEYVSSAGCSRFDNQVANAVRSGWTEIPCPIKPSGKIRKYQFADFVSQSTLELQ
jgi:hypothetical protein